MANPRIEELKARFASRAIEPEGLFLLEPDDALSYIDEGIAAGLEFIGVDGFWIKGGAFQPEQDYSNDIAGTTHSYEQFIESTRALIRKGKSVGVVFEVWFDNG